MATIRLFTFPPSQNAVRTEIALNEKGLVFERVELDLLAGEHKQPPLSQLSPRMQAPTLVMPTSDGELVVYESIATIRLIDDLFPDPPLMPPASEPRRRAAALMRIEEFQAKLDPKNIFGSVLFARKSKDELAARIDALVAELEHWERYATGTRFLAGEQFTLADIAVFPVLMHFEILGFPFADTTPALADYINRCKQRESVVKTGWLPRLQAFVAERAPERVLA